MKNNNLEVVLYPNKVLRAKAIKIEKITPDYKTLAENMLEIMYKEDGVGLAGNQVDILEQIIVIDLQKDDEHNPIVMINPKITKKSEEKIIYKEGCLSLPHVFHDIERHQEVTVEYQDLDGNHQTVTAQDFFAVCLQHEIDHLNGILFIDHLSPLKKSLLIKKYKKIQKEEKSA